MDIEQEDEEMRKIKEELRKVYEEECPRNEEKLRESEKEREREIEQFLIKLDEDARRSYELYKQSEEYKQREERGREYREWQRKLEETPETNNGGEWLEAMWHEHERELRERSSRERENLIIRLKQMAEDDIVPKIERRRFEGAMCYCPPASDTLYSFICPECGREVKVRTYKDSYEKGIEIVNDIVHEIESLGYDVKARWVCSVCSQREKKAAGIDLLFYIRFKDMKTYHVALASIEKLRMVLAFLKGECKRQDFNNFEQIDVIEEMTGIKSCPKCGNEIRGVEHMSQCDIDRMEEMIRLVNMRLQPYFHMRAKRLCSACNQIGIDMYLYTDILNIERTWDSEEEKHCVVPASMEELEIFLALLNEKEFKDYEDLEMRVETIQSVKEWMKEDMCPKGGYERFVEYLDFLKKIVGIES
ncbi:hypothetical protein [Parabacteroides sp.]